MLSEDQTTAVAAVAAMSNHHGSYGFLCETGGAPFLSHTSVGHQLYQYTPDADPD